MLLTLRGLNMPENDAQLSIEDLINSLQSLDATIDKKVFKSKLFSSNPKLKIMNEVPMENPFESDIPDNSRAQLIINNSVREIADMPACVHFTNFSSPNISKDYKFANAAPMHNCSNGKIHLDPNAANVCPTITSQSSCFGYSMDFSILSKYEYNSISYYLIRYRKITGSISYLIADSTGNVYQTVSHDSSLSNKENDFDQDAISIFTSYISDLTLTSSFDLEFPVSEKEQQEKPSSYLSYILG